MEIFSNEIAATLQYFTFPMEVVGLTLATIEVRFPEVAGRLNGYLLKDLELSGSQLKDFAKGKKWFEPPPNSPFTEKQHKWLTISGYVFLFGCMVFFIAHLFESGLYMLALRVFVAPFIAVAGTALLVILFFPVYRFINHWVPGRTVGTLGILIAGFGVLGEAYQFTTQLVV